MSGVFGSLRQRLAHRNERLKRFAAREPAVTVSLTLGGIGILMPLIVFPFRNFIGSKGPEALPPPPRMHPFSLSARQSLCRFLVTDFIGRRLSVKHRSLRVLCTATAILVSLRR